MDTRKTFILKEADTISANLVSEDVFRSDRTLLKNDSPCCFYYYRGLFQGKWVYGSLVQLRCGYYILPFCKKRDDLKLYKVNPSSIEITTGEYDDNGVLVFSKFIPNLQLKEESLKE